ncbi:MAG: transcriptional repressor NrdR [Phycisphaerae bacterium]|nr:transcriptional repressor NrdR [Phycisphaerae bacterium]
MRCPFCKEDKDKVIDSRASEGGRVIRRRRECLACTRRFTTRERVDDTIKLQVIKKDGSRAPFDRNKIAEGLQRACYKRPISADVLERMVEEVEEEVFQNFDREVKSQFIGERVMRKLRQIDQVAYVRFASVYHDFKDVHEFIDEVQEVRDLSRAETPGQRTLFE